MTCWKELDSYSVLRSTLNWYFWLLLFLGLWTSSCPAYTGVNQGSHPSENIPFFPCPSANSQRHVFLSTKFLICCWARRKTILSTHKIKHKSLQRANQALYGSYSFYFLLPPTIPSCLCPAQGVSQEILVYKHMTTERHDHKITSKHTQLLVLCLWTAPQDKIGKLEISLLYLRCSCFVYFFPTKNQGLLFHPQAMRYILNPTWEKGDG